MHVNFEVDNQVELGKGETFSGKADMTLSKWEALRNFPKEIKLEVNNHALS